MIKQQSSSDIEKTFAYDIRTVDVYVNNLDATAFGSILNNLNDLVLKNSVLTY